MKFWFIAPFDIFSITDAFLFSREPNPEHDTIAPYLLRSPIDEEGICFDFIKEAIKRFDDDEAFPAIFNDAMVKISTQLAGMSMGDDYKPHVQVSLPPPLYPLGTSYLSLHLQTFDELTHDEAYRRW